MQSFDKDRSGEIDEDEFFEMLTVAGKLSPQTSECCMKPEAGCVRRQDHPPFPALNGLSIPEPSRCSCWLSKSAALLYIASGAGWNVEDAHTAFLEVNTDGQGGVSLDEFEQWWLKRNQDDVSERVARHDPGA